MKILIDGRLISDKTTGISRYTEELVKIYIKIFGKESIVLLLSENVDKKFDGVNTLKTFYRPFNVLHFLKFHSFLRGLDFDVYHSMFYANSFFKLKGKIYITTVHDLMYRILPNFFSKNYAINTISILYFNFIVSRSLKNSNFIISVSKATKKDVFNIHSKKSTVITEGGNKLVSNSEKLELNNFMVEKKDYFLYVGNNRPHKNIDFLKRCYLNSDSLKKLVIVGHKGTNIRFHDKHIMYTGHVNDCTLQFLYENSSAFILPSLYEGFGLPVIEAINLNTLVFTSNQGSLIEFESDNVKYFDPSSEENLVKLINNVDQFHFSLDEKNRLLGQHNWSVVKDQLMHFYEDNI